MPERLATIDVGTNTVLLLVAERRGRTFVPLAERAEITRLGRGVDATGRLDPAAIADTVAAVAAFAREARSLGVERIACVATSAARDATNGEAFFAAARAGAGVDPEVISGDEEARLVWTSAWRDFGFTPDTTQPSEGQLAVLDVGGGSTEFTFGSGAEPSGRTSLQVGAVRLTERHLRHDPVTRGEAARLLAAAREAVRPLQGMAAGGATPGSRLVGVAGTVTTLSAVEQALTHYDAGRVHGATLSLPGVERLWDRLAALTVKERAALPGMEPKRADVILAGCAIVLEAMRATGFDRLTVSDRGVRWGLLYDRAGA
ncbi:MAG TPA: Ppx/GppA family phosphatase [Anaeromyxobacteraceae bacterium]|nr:Ppx/GppA family phosphatase [Anaeromyxobacteraceae bacterium]